MSDDKNKKPRHAPPPVADDDDDGDTVVDSGLPSLAELQGLGGTSDETDTDLDIPALDRSLELGRPLPMIKPIEAVNRRSVSLPRHLPPITGDDDDDDETYVLPRKDQSQPRQAVPLPANAQPTTPPRPPPTSRSAGKKPRRLDDDGFLQSEEETAHLPLPRPLAAVPAISAEEFDDHTLSRPRVKRATFQASGEGTPARILQEIGIPSLDGAPLLPDEDVAPPPPNVRREESLPMFSLSSTDVGPNPLDDDQSTGDMPSADDAVGQLVIDVPDDAVVFVDGTERGRGRTVVDNVSRYAEFTIRVHLAGHHPWTGVATLQGLAEAVVRPDLVARTTS